MTRAAEERTAWRAGGARLGLVADDLTGAADAAAAFAQAGRRTVLLLDGAVPSAPPDVLALVADSRAAGAGAADLTAAAVRRLGAVDALYLKVDSTLRGPLGPQVTGALQAWHERVPDAFAVVCPAYPRHGRTLVDGVVRVDGRPVHEAPQGQDPVAPARVSSLRELLPGSRFVPDDGTSLTEALTRAAAPGAVLTLDARDDRALLRIADAVRALGPRAVPVGSAGLAAALAGDGDRMLPTGGSDRPVLVLLSSLHPSARAQEARLREVLADRLLLLGPGACVEPRHLVLLARTPLVPVGVPGATVATRLAHDTAALLCDVPLAGAVAVGGDGALALLAAWRATGLAVEGLVDEGVPSGWLLGGTRAGLRLVTKSGGFGGPGTLLHLVAHLSTHVPPPERTS